MDFNILKEKALKANIKEIEEYTLVKNQVTVSTLDQEVNSSVVAKTIATAIRGVYNNQIATVYIENTSDDMINYVIKTLKENASLINKEEPYFIYEGSKIYPTIDKKENDFNDFILKDKTNILLSLDKEAKKYSNLVYKTQAGYTETYLECFINNSNGLNVSRKDEYASIYFSVVCKKEEEMKTKNDYELLTKIKDFNIEKFTHNVVDKAVKSLGAKSIESKSRPVVLDSQAFGKLMNSFASVFSAENVIKNLSFLEGKINNQVFGKNITLIDDPLDQRANNQTTFDDEGVATFKNAIVENGILKTYFHNLKTAKMLNTKTTANGYKSSPASNVSISSSNFYIKNDDISFDNMIVNINDGVYITDLEGMHAGVNKINGDFSLQASGYLIKEGKLKEPITLIIVSGNIVKLLNNVANISNDFNYKSGFGTGSVYVKELNISGQ